MSWMFFCHFATFSLFKRHGKLSPAHKLNILNDCSVTTWFHQLHEACSDMKSSISWQNSTVTKPSQFSNALCQSPSERRVFWCMSRMSSAWMPHIKFSLSPPQVWYEPSSSTSFKHFDSGGMQKLLCFRQWWVFSCTEGTCNLKTSLALCIVWCLPISGIL